MPQILTDRAVDSGVTIEYGSTISDLRDEGDHVEVTRGDGSRRRADLVVGADGVRSVVVRPDRPGPGVPVPQRALGPVAAAQP
jgi:2-polyprenyl-6-methoxyphenol hydroxylase-like FAD-dependent oxidoreductase